MVVTEADALGTITVGYRVPGLIDSVAAAQGILSNPTPLDLTNSLFELLRRRNYNRTPTISPAGVQPWRKVALSILQETSRIRWQVTTDATGIIHERCDG